MAHRIGDVIKEMASTSGLTDFTRAGAVAGFDPFSRMPGGWAVGDTTWYMARNASEWEEGLGTEAAGSVLQRTTVLRSSNADAKVNFSAPPVVFCTFPAAQLKARTADSPQLVANAADDEFDGGALDTAGTRRSGATAWAWRNQATATAAQASGSLVLSCVSNGGANNPRIVEQVLPASGTWKYRARLAAAPGQQAGSSSTGLTLLNSTSGKLYVFATFRDGTNIGWGINRFTTVTAYASNAWGNNGATLSTDTIARFGLPHEFHYMEIAWDGTNYTFGLSKTGVDGTFTTVLTEPPSTFLGTADRIGIALDAYSQPAKTVCDWFRRVA